MTTLEDEAGNKLLSGSRRMAEAAIDLLGLPACLLDDHGALLYRNAAWSDFADPVNSHCDDPGWSRLIPPEHRDAAMSLLQASAGSTARIDFECPLIDAGGGQRWFLLGLHTPIHDQQGGSWRICTATDIQAIKLREAALEQRRSIQADMLDVSVDCIKVLSPEGGLVHMNKAGCRSLGVPDGGPFGMPWLPLLPQGVREAGAVALASARAGIPSRFPGRSVIPGHEEQHWDNLLTPILDRDAALVAILCVSREVTAETRALESLRASEERLAIAARVGGLGIWDYDIRNDKLYCDDSWYRIMGREEQSSITSIAGFRPFIHPDDVEKATEVMKTASEVIAAERDYAITFRIIRPNGEVRWVRSLAYVQHDSGVAARATGFVADITDARRGELALRDANRTLEAEKTSLARDALEDSLTGIANRRHFDSEFARIMALANESGEPVCMGMIDVDRFKQFNDRYGHPEGDLALRRIAMSLLSVARQADLVARYGGEEFAFVLVGTDDPIPAIERFMSAVFELAIPHQDSPTGRVSISCGAVVARQARVTPGQLFKAGDEALYEAKTAGRDRYVVRTAGT